MYVLLYFIFFIALLVFAHRNMMQELFICKTDIFLSKTTMKEFLIADKDSYIRGLTKSDLIARNVKSKKEYLHTIVNESCGDFTNNERKKIASYLSQIKNKLFGLTYQNIHFKDIIECNFVFAKVIGKKYENGLPHTRSNVIFIQSRNINATTILHEMIHIYQRKYPLQTNEFIKKTFSCLPHTKIKAYPLIRANPDLNIWCYVCDGVLWKYEYKNKFPRSINDVKIETHPEHPFEEMAYLLAKFI